MHYEFDSQSFDINAVAIPNSQKYACEVVPQGRLLGFLLREPNATTEHGPTATFDSESEAITAGVFHIHTDTLRVGPPTRIIRMMRMAETIRPGGKFKLIISSFDLDAWLFSASTDWTSAGWEIFDDRLGQANLTRDELLDALRQQLSRVDIDIIDVDNSTLYSRVVPID